MKRKNTQSIGEVLKEFMESNTELQEQIFQTRVKRGWHEILGPMIHRYTSNIYIKHQILYVSLTSSVLRNELILSKDKLIKSLNDFAGSVVIRDIVIR